VPLYRTALLRVQLVLDSIASHDCDFAAATKAMSDWQSLARLDQWVDLDELLELELAMSA
jgi:hypothetical protein